MEKGFEEVRVKITYYVHDLRFPLMEGIRKQAFWLAKEMKKLGHNVTIISTSSKKGIIIKDGIKIIYGSPLSIRKQKTGIMHYLVHPTPYIIPLLLCTKAKKSILTFFGGKLNIFYKHIWSKPMIWLVNKKINIITAQTDYQLNLIRKTGLKKPVKLIMPLIKRFKRKEKKSAQPTILFMSHLSKVKGILDLLNAFKIVKKEIKNAKLVIAKSGLIEEKDIKAKIKALKKDFKEDIIIKGIVNPEEELSKAWLYVYPIQSAQETFSIPLSLIEASQTKTSFLVSDVGAMNEFFNKKTLVKPKNPKQLAEKIIELIKNPKTYKLKREFDNIRIIKDYIRIYKENEKNN